MTALKNRVFTYQHLHGPTAESVTDQLKTIGGDWSVEDADGLVVRKCVEVEAWMAEVYREVAPGEPATSWHDSYRAAVEAVRSRQQRANE